MKTDVVVIGGGIAGVSVGYWLAETHDVVVLEAEEQLSYHSSGRSAALFIENYGVPANRSLTLASRRFFTAPPAELVDAPLVSPRGVLWVGRPDQADQLREIASSGRRIDSTVYELDPSEVVDRVPVVRAELLAGGVLEPGVLDIDVAATHQAFLRGLRIRGGEVLSSAPVRLLDRSNGRWIVRTDTAVINAAVVVNAAGAWGDAIAMRAGIDRVGLQPLRRTAFMVAGDASYAGWPMVIDADHDFYFKPDGVQLLCSPADETPCEPADVRPDALDVALAIDRINHATTLEIRSVRSEWAGLRTFVHDRAMVIGHDPVEPTFFWLVGQGGTGIQTAPAAGELAAALIRGDELPVSFTEASGDFSLLSASRASLSRT